MSSGCFSCALTAAIEILHIANRQFVGEKPCELLRFDIVVERGRGQRRRSRLRPSRTRRVPPPRANSLRDVGQIGDQRLGYASDGRHDAKSSARAHRRKQAPRRRGGPRTRPGIRARFRKRSRSRGGSDTTGCEAAPKPPRPAPGRTSARREARELFGHHADVVMQPVGDIARVFLRENRMFDGREQREAVSQSPAFLAESDRSYFENARSIA